MMATDEVWDEPKAYLWMAGQALQGCIGDFFFLARILFSGQKSARKRDQWLSPTFVLLNSAPS